MTYDNDDPLRSVATTPKDAKRHVDVNAGLSPFVFGTIVLALLLGGVYMFSASDTNTASNQNGTTVSAPARVAPPASTTGSGSTSPGPINPGTPPNSR